MKKLKTINYFKKLICENKKIVFISVAFGLIMVESFFIAQIVFVIKHFKAQYMIVPTLLGLSIGILLAGVLILRRQLSKQNDIFHAIADQAFEFSFYRKTDGTFIYVSPAVEALTGYPAEDFYQDHTLLRQLLHPDDQLIWDNHVHEVNEHHHHIPLLLRIINKKGQQRWIQHLCSSVTDDEGNVIGIRSTNADVTNEVNSKHEIEHMANYDPLTELPNRRRLTQHINELIGLEDENEQTIFAVMFVDLDRFKYINDTYGHTFGDRFLRLIAERFKRNCSSKTLVSRFGGDEFVVVTPCLDKADEASGYAEKIIHLLERAVEINNKKLYISASVGISIYPIDGNDADTLIKHADVAMYQSKGDGSSVHYATSNMVSKASKILTLETRLRQAIDKDELLLFYQPKVKIPENKVIGYEALARWQTSEGDLISPAEFIPLAEETNLIIPISEILMAKLNQQIAIWSRTNEQYCVAFNLSARQLKDPECCQKIVSKWSETGLPLDLLEIEITESMLMTNFELVIQQLKYLRQHGIKISLDDFGTGYSSLAYLRNLPVDNLKIDKSFIDNLTTSQQDSGIVKTIITLAENLNMNVIAEGVEQKEQMELLLELGCHQVQGYYFGKPVPPELIFQKLKNIANL